MAVKVGNSWVTEAAYAYAKSKVDENTSSENKKGNSMLDKLSEKYPDIKFSTSTQPFSGTGKNNIGIAPNILREMENDPEKRLEYEALIYDCSQVIKNLPDKMPNGSRLKSFGFIINSDPRFPYRKGRPKSLTAGCSSAFPAGITVLYIKFRSPPHRNIRPHKARKTRKGIHPCGLMFPEDSLPVRRQNACSSCSRPGLNF